MSLLPKIALDAMIWVPGGTFAMGSDRHYAEEGPVHRVTVDGFWMDPSPVTNRQFRQFRKATTNRIQRSDVHALLDGSLTGVLKIGEWDASVVAWFHELGALTRTD